MSLQEQILRLQSLFRGNSRIIGLASNDLVDEGNGKLNQSSRRFAAGPATTKHWERHLLGIESLGLVPINDHQEVKFMAIDVDLDIMEELKVTLASLAAQIEAAKLPFIVCRSKSGAAHLYVFFKDNIKVAKPRQALQSMAAFLGLLAGNRPIEYFPHTSNLNPDSNGKYINLPYFNSDDGERFALDSEGNRLSLDDFITLAEGKLITSSDFCKWQAPKSEDEFLRDVISNGPPCLQTIYDQGIEDGTKNDILLQFGILFKKYSEETYVDNVELINRTRCDTPHDFRDLQRTLKGLKNKDYHYNCAHPCMAPICAKSLCMGRKYGIKAKINFPIIKEVVQWGADDEYFELHLEDGRKLRILAAELLDFNAVQAEVVRSLHIVLPIPKPMDWREFCFGLMGKVKRVEINKEFSVEHSIRGLIVAYATSRTIGTKLEDLLVRKPVKDGSNILIRHKDLQEEIARRRFPGYIEGLEYSVVINDLKGSITVKEIGTEKYPVFVIPDPKVDQEKILKEVATEFKVDY